MANRIANILRMAANAMSRAKGRMEPYDEEKAFKTSAASTARRIKHRRHQAQTPGFKLVPA